MFYISSAVSGEKYELINNQLIPSSTPTLFKEMDFVGSVLIYNAKVIDIEETLIIQSDDNQDRFTVISKELMDWSKKYKTFMFNITSLDNIMKFYRHIDKYPNGVCVIINDDETYNNAANYGPDFISWDICNTVAWYFNNEEDVLELLLRYPNFTFYRYDQLLRKY